MKRRVGKINTAGVDLGEDACYNIALISPVDELHCS